MSLKEKHFDDVFSKKYSYPYDKVIDFKPFLTGYEFNSILEVGCGNGRNLNYFRSNYKGLRVSGVELSNVGVGCCVKNNLDVVYGSADDLPFGDSSFDSVLTVHSLEQMKYIIDDVLNEIYRVSKKYVFCFEPVFSEQNIFGKFHNLSMDYVKGLPFLLEKHGFSILEFRNLLIGSFKNRTCLIVGIKKG